MVTRTRQVIGVAWPVALLAVFGVAFGAERRPFLPGQAAECVVSETPDLTVLERCLAVQPDDIELMIGLGRRYAALQRWTDASRILKRALSIDPSDGDVHVLLGQALLALHDAAGARAEGQAALTIKPGNAAAVQLAGVQDPPAPQP
jgi:tetratricopeptide (TPR) repeat protein